ncbi:hypothetical protein BRARA_F01554 [Brassica rapa]|uniref:C3H1-type domain-containing protein n=1 Tax=Brassica campestris TaxID=3711 RepID=A0A397YXP9_BRACM|nr:hypothetical protein BRARA_F01554 [Brassica rapa]
MDSFHYNQSYDQWNSPYSPHHPPPAPLLLPLLPPPRQSHPDSPNFYLPSTHNSGQRKDGHHYSHRQYFSPNPAVNQSSSYYLQHPPPPHQHHPPLLPPQQHQPYIPQQSPWAGYKDKRVDSWTDAGPGRMYTSGRRLDPSPSHDYQYDYSRSSRDSSGVSINRGLDGSFRSRDEFRNTGYVRKESRIEGSYQDRGQLKTKSDRCFRGLGECNRNLASRVGYGTDLYGVTVSRDMGRPYASHEGTRNQRWNEGKILYPRKKDDYYHSETEQYFDRGRREESSELNRTPRKQMLKKSALLRRETTRNHQKGRENGRNHSNYNGKRFNSNLFRGKEHLGHSDRGLVEKQRERTPVDLDVSFELNLPVAKPIASPTGAGIHPSRSVTPRSFKARRALVPDKSENPSVTEGNGKLRTQFSDEASVSEGSRPSKKQSISSEIEKKPGNHSTHFVDGVVNDCEVKITDEGPEALTREVIITVDAAEKNSSVCEALKEAKDDSDVEHDSNMGVCSIIEDVIERGKSILNSQDVLNRTGCNAGEALPPKVMEMEDIVKESTNRSPTKLLLSVSTAADLSEYSEAVVRFARKSMYSVESHHCEDVAMDFGSLDYVDKVLEKSSRDASIYFNKEDPGHQATKLDTCGIEDGSNGINKNVNSLSPENDCCRGLIFSASLEIPSVSMELANANNNISGDLANAHSFTIGTYPSTIVDSPDMNESKNFTHCEDTANPSVENGSIKESMETKPLRSVAEMADNLESESDEGIQTCVKGTSSSHSKVDVKGSLVVLPVERTDGYSRSYESDLDIAVPSEEGMESLSAERLAPVEDLGLTSNQPSEIPSVDKLSGSNNRNLKTCLPEPNVSLNKDITYVGINGMFANETVTKADSGPHERQPCSPVGKFLPEDQGGCRSSGAFGSVWNFAVKKNLEVDLSRVSACLVSDNSVSPCHFSFLMAMNEQMQNKTYHEKNNCAENVAIDIQEEKTNPSGGTLKCKTLGTDIVAVTGDSSFGQILSETHVAAKVDETYNVKQKSKHYGVPFDSLSNSPNLYRPIQSETHVASMVDDSNNYNEKAKPSGGTTKYRTLEIDVNSDVGGLEKYSRNIIKNDIFDGEALSADGKVVGTEILENKSTGSASKVAVGDDSFLVKAGEIPTLEKQSKPPSDSSTSKVSNAIDAPSGKCALSYSMDHPTTGLPESIMDSATSGEASVPHSGGDTSKTSDIPIQTDYASNCQQKKIPPNLDSSDLKRTVYVKRKANQLVAASDIHSKSRSQFSTSDGYFKRNKNQLVRTSESRVNHSPDDALDSRASATMVSERSSSSAFSDAAVTRPYKRSKFSLVWTQNDQQSDLPSSHMRYRRILPQLVPWKRVTYWRRLMNSVSALRNGSFSNISQKLSTMRKRHTVYTRSTNGYSLRKSKVLSIGGSHLKWSKSIERDSRKANEEATLAVAAFSKKENEKHSGQSSTRKTSRNHLARGRIFRFGSLRYKMDPSRRTLQRISDVDSPCSGPTENGKGAKRPFIPKRLVIGHEEYVRVGNGNQLVRDPKKRTRALANEKVRWSLHNVRLRLAKKKKKYCQFFTRFGKCNKDDGKCPYVHDPSKIAVCTKFLNGLCANDNCKLTHKVIPERMPDCSYFLQGLCNNEACPYRHVHVNPSAAICDGFLKGYCSDGNECRKKHSYTCPDFEATGSCPQGSKCKLHHPKSQGKGRKRKRPSEPLEKNARGRYFGSLQKLFSESEPMVVDRHPTESEDFGKEGFEFISLGATEEEAGENNDQATEQSISSESEEPASIYELIKPVALMR